MTDKDLCKYLKIMRDVSDEDDELGIAVLDAAIERFTPIPPGKLAEAVRVGARMAEKLEREASSVPDCAGSNYEARGCHQQAAAIRTLIRVMRQQEVPGKGKIVVGTLFRTPNGRQWMVSAEPRVMIYVLPVGEQGVPVGQWMPVECAFQQEVPDED